MSNKPRRGSKGKNVQAIALKQNIAALGRHTKELKLSSAALAAHTEVVTNVSARHLVYSVLNEPLTLPDTTLLSDLGLDPGALFGTAESIRARGVKVDTGAVQACD